MSDKTPTAVEWLVEKLGEIIGTGLQKVIEEEVQQALEMEKQQIIDAYKADMHPCSDEDAEQYYTETYKP